MKKYFSLLLICILLIGILPFSVRAEDGENTEITIPPNGTEPVKWTISLKDDETYEIVGMEYFSGYLSGTPTISLPTTYNDISITSVRDDVKVSNLNSHIAEIDKISIPSEVIIGKDFLSNLGENSLDIDAPAAVDASFLVNSPKATVTYPDNAQMGWLAGDTDNSLYWTNDGNGTNRKLFIASTGEGSFETIPVSFSSDYNTKEVSISDVEAIPANFCNSRVTTVTLDNTVTSIGENAFPGVVYLTFNGTKSEWDAITKPEGFPGDKVTVTIQKVSVTFNPGKGGTLAESTVSPQILDKNDKVSKPDNPIPNDGYSFNGEWYKIIDGSEPAKWDFSTSVTEDIVLQAGWNELDERSININVTPPAGGSIQTTVSPGDKIVEGKLITVTFIANPGFSYKSCEIKTHTTNESITLSEENTFTMPDQDVDISAEFEAIDYTVTIDNPNEGGTVTANKVEKLNVGNTVTLTASPAQYKQISDWGVKDADDEVIEVTVSEDDPNKATFTMPASNVTINPQFTDQSKYEIGFMNAGDRLYIQLDENHKDEKEAFAGEQIQLTITPPKHYILNKLEYKDEDEKIVLLTDENITSFTFTMPASDIKLMPDFEELPKRTRIYLNGDLNPEKPLDKLEYYVDETPPVTDKKPTKATDKDYSYTFEKWDTGKTEGSVTTFTPVFKKDPVPRTIIVDAYGEGLVSVDSSDYSTRVTVQAPEGTKLSIKVKPLNNNYFVGFDTNDETGTLSASTFTVGKSDARIRATFRENKQVQIKFDANGGTGTMAPVQSTSGSTYKLPENAFTPPQGKQFFCWQIEDKSFSVGDSVSVKEDNITVKAIWKDSDQISYTVTFLMDNEYQFAVQTVIKGNMAAKPSDPSKDGYLFVGWYTDSGLTVPFSFNTPIESNMTLYAKWTPKASETEETIEYTVVEGAAQKWTKNTTVMIDIRAKRNINDDTTVKHFVSLQIDGKALVKDTDYTVSEGSIIVSIKPAALQNLANGIHRVTFVFDDGKAETTLTILEAAEGESKGSGSSSGGSSSVPKTGDIFSNPTVWFGGMLVVMFILRLFIRARKSRIAEAAFMQNEKY